MPDTDRAQKRNMVSVDDEEATFHILKAIGDRGETADRYIDNMSSGANVKSRQKDVERLIGFFRKASKTVAWCSYCAFTLTSFHVSVSYHPFSSYHSPYGLLWAVNEVFLTPFFFVTLPAIAIVSVASIATMFGFRSHMKCMNEYGGEEAETLFSSLEVLSRASKEGKPLLVEGENGERLCILRVFCVSSLNGTYFVLMKTFDGPKLFSFARTPFACVSTAGIDDNKVLLVPGFIPVEAPLANNNKVSIAGYVGFAPDYGFPVTVSHLVKESMKNFISIVNNSDSDDNGPVITFTNRDAACIQTVHIDPKTLGNRNGRNIEHDASLPPDICASGKYALFRSVMSLLWEYSLIPFTRQYLSIIGIFTFFTVTVFSIRDIMRIDWNAPFALPVTVAFAGLQLAVFTALARTIMEVGGYRFKLDTPSSCESCGPFYNLSILGPVYVRKSRKGKSPFETKQGFNYFRLIIITLVSAFISCHSGRGLYNILGNSYSLDVFLSFIVIAPVVCALIRLCNFLVPEHYRMLEGEMDEAANRIRNDIS